MGKDALPDDGDDLGVVENRHTPDGSDEPRDDIAALNPGDVVVVLGQTFRVPSTSQRVNSGKRSLYAIGVPPEAFGTVGTLYVDRDPYRLDITNGKVYDVDPSEVEVLTEADLDAERVADDGEGDG